MGFRTRTMDDKLIFLPFMIIKTRIQSLLWQSPLIRFILKMAFDRLFQVRLGYTGLGDCPAWLGNWPCMVRASRRGQKQEKRCCENTNNRPLRGVATKVTMPQKSSLGSKNINCCLLKHLVIGKMSPKTENLQLGGRLIYCHYYNYLFFHSVGSALPNVLKY